MDLLKLFGSAAGEVADDLPKPPPDLPTTSDGKSEWFYTLLVDKLSKTADRGASVRNDTVRASRMAETLASLPRLRKCATFAEAFSGLREESSGTQPPGSQATLDTGHAAHHWWQNEYLGPWGLLWGRWLCYRCDHITVGFFPRVCPECRTGKRFIYEETDLFDPGLRYTGHPDGLLAVLGSTLPNALLELKTIGTAGWKQLTRPKPDHVIQVHCYMQCAAKIYGVEPIRQTFFIYIDKGKQALYKRLPNGTFKCISPPRWKVFHQPFDDKLWASIERDLGEFWEIYDRLKAEAAA